MMPWNRMNIRTRHTHNLCDTLFHRQDMHKAHMSHAYSTLIPIKSTIETHCLSIIFHAKCIFNHISQWNLIHFFPLQITLQMNIKRGLRAHKKRNHFFIHRFNSIRCSYPWDFNGFWIMKCVETFWQKSNYQNITRTNCYFSVFCTNLNKTMFTNAIKCI